MEKTTDFMPDHPPRFLRQWGFWALVFGGLALVLVFAQIAGPSFETKPSAAQQIGEIAGEMKRAAWRSFLGLEQPAPEPVKTPIWDYLGAAAPVLGVIAIILSALSAILRENWRYPVYGTGLGAAAIVFYFFWWVALLIAGVILLVAIIENLGSFFAF